MDRIKITIDGKEMTGKKGDTILQIAVANDVDIPNLCYHQDLKIYGACGLCVVEAEGIPKLLRACATVAEDGMVIRTDAKRAVRAKKVAMELLMSDHEGDCKGPCSLNCPAGTNVEGYLKQIALGNDKEAVRIIKEKIPFPASIGRVCPHPCEEHCRRGLVEEPLSIAYLKAFAADNDRKSGDPFHIDPKPDTGKSVAVIGGGPAGLSAAYYLRLAGHKVTVYDAMPEMGGMLRYGIPEYRLPQAVLGSEISELAAIGITMKNNVTVGKDVSFADIRKSADAVLVTIGAWRSSGVGCPGEELEGVLGGIDFLREVNLGRIPDIGERVAIVGGGNTAMDACRTAIRCHAKEVYVIYRRTRAEAPAEDLEISEAMEEGVTFKFLTNPAEIIGEDGRVRAVKLQIMELGEPDASGRRKPVPVEGKFETIEIDTLISAIGQSCDPTGLDELALGKRGTITADESTCETNLEGVFAAGDATNRGASIAIEAIAEGNQAARSIDAYLNNQPLFFPKPYYSERQVTSEMLADRPKEARQIASVRDPESRRKGFEEVLLGFSDEQARKEAARCLECGCHDYEDCRLIYYANSMAIDPKRLAGEKHDTSQTKLESIVRDQGKCILCNLCVRTCEETVKKGILGLVGRGFNTVIRPEVACEDVAELCATCHKCVDVCPTGALK